MREPPIEDPVELADSLLSEARHDNELGRFDRAAATLDRALDLLAAADGDPAHRLRIRVLITRSWTELEVRGHAAAMAMLTSAREQASAVSDRHLFTLSLVQEGTVHVRGGDWEAAIAALDRIGAVDEATLNPAQQCAMLINRGLAGLGLGRTDQARDDLSRAATIAAREGFAEQEFKARHNLACLAFVDGDLPRALLLMAEADAMDAAVARDRARLDHAEVLLEAGLVDGARSALREALEAARHDGHRLEQGEINLRLARCDLLVDDLEGARHHVRSATAAYRTRQADELVGEAELIRATIDVAAGHDVPAVVAVLSRRNDQPGARTGARRAAARLEAEARLLLGDVDGAESRLATLGGADRESLASRLHETLVRARLDHAHGRFDEAERRIVTGNRLLAAHQFQSSSLDLRAALALHGRRLASFDIERAVADGDTDRILTSVERWRAISHRINPVTTASDTEITAMTRELRRLRRLAADDSEGRSSGLHEQIAALEDRVMHREWTLTEEGSRRTTVAAIDAAELRAVTRDRNVTVVEFFEVGEDLWTIVAADGALNGRPIARVDEVASLVTRLRRDLRARAMVSTGSPMAPTLERATASSLAALDAVLNPGGATDATLVVIPSGSLTAVPWGLLPSLRGRPVTIAPSSTRWLRGPSRPPEVRWAKRVAALHGPGLTRTGSEIGAIRAAWANGQVDLGAGPDVSQDFGPATSGDVLAALSSARVVHLAAHGTHEGQSPLFSSVQMADGPVFAHEFPRPVVAEHVTLSACDVGQFSTRPGDEPLGLATALLALGSTSVLAAVAPVADDLAADAMVRYHRVLSRGEDAASAWATVVEAEPDAGVFCLYGSDWSATD